MVRGRGFNLVIIQTINVIAVYVTLTISLHLLNSYLGLLGFFFSTLVNMFLIFYFLKKMVAIDIRNYLHKINFSDILKLNAILIAQLFSLYFLPGLFNYIQFAFFVIYSIAFYKYGIEFIKIVKDKFLSGNMRESV
jgi:hypothetical protein